MNNFLQLKPQFYTVDFEGKMNVFFSNIHHARKIKNHHFKLFSKSKINKRIVKKMK